MTIGAEEEFKGVVDLVKMKAILWNEEDQGMTFEYDEFLMICSMSASNCVKIIIEAAAEASDELMEKYLEEVTHRSRN